MYEPASQSSKEKKETHRVTVNLAQMDTLIRVITVQSPRPFVVALYAKLKDGLLDEKGIIDGDTVITSSNHPSTIAFQFFPKDEDLAGQVAESFQRVISRCSSALSEHPK